ncbi:MAG: serine hydrolase domain-containing protein [Bacteroidia bacterium]
MKQILLFTGLLMASFSFSQSINKDNIDKLIQLCDSTKADEILISYKGEIITHWKRTSFDNCLIVEGESKCNDSLMNTASMLKSWVGVLIGIAIDKGLIESVDTPVCQYLPEWEQGCTNQITIKHLLTMSAGIRNKAAGNSILVQRDMNSYVVNIKPDTLPEIYFSYSNESVQILGLIIEKVTQKDLDKVFDEFLFKKLNMNSTNLEKDSVGNTVAFGGCQTTVLDAHNLALMMLNKGEFNNERVVSENWITQSLMPSKKAQYYGYLWWLDKKSNPWNYAATGDLGNMTIIFPEIDLIFIRRQSCDMSKSSKSMTWMGPIFLKSISDIIQ